MARIRTIKPEFWAHEDLSELPADTHILAAALLNHADDEGYFNANPKLVKAACSPLRESSVSIHESLTQLSNIGFIRIGEGSDGKTYGHVVKFLEHQRINRPTKSKISSISIDWDISLKAHTQINEDSHPERKGKEGKGKEQGKNHCASDNAPDVREAAFALFWESGMVKTNKQKARTKFMRICGKEPMAFAQHLRDDIHARLAAKQMGFDAMHPTTYLNGERWNDEIKQGAADQRGPRLSPLEQYQADLRERDAQRAAGGMAMGEDDRSVRGDMAEGEGQGSYLDLDPGDWQTRSE